MVLLNDDDAEKPAPTRRARWTKRIIWTVLFLAFFFWIGLIILGRLGGNSQALHEGMESFLSRMTGLNAQIETFHGMTFYPYVSTYAEGISMYNPSAQTTGEDDAAAPASAAPVVEIGSLKFARSFWDIFFSRQTLHDLELRDVNMAAGYRLPHALRGAVIEMIPADGADSSATLSVTGTYGGEELDFTLDINHTQDGNRQQYSLPEQSGFALTLGTLSAAGTMTRSQWRGVSFAFDILEIGPDGAYDALLPLQGSLDLTRSGDDIAYDIKLTRAEGDLNLRYDDRADTDELTLRAARMNAAAIPDMIAVIQALSDLYSPDGEGIGLSHNIDFSMTVDELLLRDGTLGDLKIEGSVTDNILKTETITGTISGGALDGDITLNAAQDIATLDIALQLDNWDYARLQAIRGQGTAIHGNADARVKLTAQGTSYDALWAGLNGDMIVIGAGGRMAGGVLNTWGQGILNNLLPDFGTQDPLAVNCLMMRFDVENSIATADPALLDTEQVTVTGEGTIDLDDRTIDMVFTPDAKGLSLGTVGPAVRVEGALANPTVGADTFSLGKKLGALLLGTVNPAFWAWTLTDIGVGENHPCREYLDEDTDEE